jgi:ubiquinone/menaquinone biosynthesis C-methylase UbiE
MPDKIGVKPSDFFNYEKAKSYESSSSIYKSQIEISNRLNELLNLTNKKLILDLGCGTGISSKFFKNQGHRILGIDISNDMLKFSNKKEIEVVNGVFGYLPFRNEIFEALISISSLQWVWGSSREEVIAKYENIIKEIKRVMRNESILGIQFYPQTKKEFDLVSKIFRKNGFDGTLVIDSWDKSNRKKKYLILKLSK